MEQTNKIEFFIPKYEEIPTKLRLKIDDKDVIYKRSHNEFAYEFEVYGINAADEGLEVVKRLSEIMCDQSYDHGSEWRVTKTEQTKELGFNSATWKVSFRIRDSY